MKRITKAIIPAAGFGTRFLPVTKEIPKEMLPVVDKPTIQYVVEEAARAGIQEIIIVTNRFKTSIEDHFDKNQFLDLKLSGSNKKKQLEEIEELSKSVTIHYLRQGDSMGLGHAIACTRKLIDGEPFAVLLGDMITDGDAPCLKELIECYERMQASLISVQSVDLKNVHKYGVIDGERMQDGLFKVNRLVEKPKIHPPSNQAIIGRYILEPSIFDAIAQTEAGAGGEIQLTDALNRLAVNGDPVYALTYSGKVYDIGEKLGYIKANIEFALHDESIHQAFGMYLKDLVASMSQNE